MPAHLLEAPVVPPLPANEDRIHCHLHVVVVAELAAFAEEDEHLAVRIERHTQALAKLGPNLEHPTVTQSYIAEFKRASRTRGDHQHVARDEVASLTRAKTHSHIGRCARQLSLEVPCSSFARRTQTWPPR